MCSQHIATQAGGQSAGHIVATVQALILAALLSMHLRLLERCSFSLMNLMNFSDSPIRASPVFISRRRMNGLPGLKIKNPSESDYNRILGCMKT